MLNKEASIHLIFSMIFNQSCKSEVAFKAPSVLLGRLKMQSYNLRELEYRGYELLYEAITMKPCLHRFPSNMTKYIYQTIITLNREYDADPRNIWLDKANSEILNRLTNLSGIGYHKAVQCLIYLNILGEIDNIAPEYVNYMAIKCTNFFNNINYDLQYIKLLCDT